nr:MAG TPA: hypothetical protein [Caudoviricetes sp.]DAZ55538.1 MAG TPA: hypothetical protein [Caudoviricetes sp.]
MMQPMLIRTILLYIIFLLECTTIIRIYVLLREHLK